MKPTTARITRNGKKFEIKVDLDEALKVKKGEQGAFIGSALLTGTVFYNIKSGENASSADLTKVFGTADVNAVAEKIIKDGEIEIPTEYLKQGMEQKYKQVVDFLAKNAVDKNSRPYTPERIQKALEEAKVNVKNKPIDEQIGEIIEQIGKVLPIRIEMKKLKITVPAQHTGKAYGILKPYMQGEEWLTTGDLEAIISLPSGAVFDFYDKLNAVTHGSAVSEDLKEEKK